jgi:uncharacterized caspase-like protein
MPVNYIKPFLTLVVLIVSLSGLAKEKIALVIGNADYTSSALVNSVNDAEDIASTLENLDFGVTLVKNATRDQMQMAISKFVDNLNDDTVGLFYYSGHAVQYKGSNYLIPIGSVDKVDYVKDLPKNTVNTSTILDGLNQSQSNLNFVFLDACRDNPFKGLGKEITPGLAKTSVGARSVSTNLIMKDLSITRGVSETHEQVKDTKGILVAYSTMPGSVASDGSGRNSPYTKSLLKHITKTNSLAQIMLSDVQQDVEKGTSGKQTPIFESAITGRFCFNEINGGCGKAVVNIYSSYLKGVKDIQKLTLSDESSYEGQVVDGKPHGKGVQIHNNGDRYEGEWRHGLGHGKGYWYGADGHYVDGEWKNDVPHGFNIVINKVGRYEGNFINGSPGGFGIYLWTNGDRYEGEWRNGNLNGNGIISWANGTSYDGKWKNGIKHGYGILKIQLEGATLEGEFVDGYINGLAKTTLKDGTVLEYEIYLDSELKKILDDGNIIPMEYIDGDVVITSPLYRYEGSVINAKKSGYGRYVESSGNSYVGNFLNNMSHGKGVSISDDGSHYKGDWIKNKREGYGVQDDVNGSRYLGNFKNNLFHGKGVLISANGSRYEGMFKNHKFHGKGVLRSYTGDKYEGMFKSDVRHGFGIMTWDNGDRYEGEWVNGKEVDNQ